MVEQWWFREILLDWLAWYRLIFVDEFGVTTKMKRAYGRSRHGKRRHANAPFGHLRSTTVVAVSSKNGVIT